MKIAVISSVYGGYDQVVGPAAQDAEAEFIMVTDRETEFHGWQPVYEPRPKLHPRLAAKVPKCNPENYSDADILIWVDGNFHIRTSDFVSWCVESLGDAVLCQHINSDRLTIYSECAIAAPMEKYAGLPVREQAEYYVSKGFPAGFGTWWTGLMIRSRNCPNFGDLWLAEMVRWTYEDQISQPYVLHGLGIRPKNLEINWLNHPRFALGSHSSSE